MLLHCLHLLGNSPKITYHLFDSSTVEQQSPQDSNENAFK